jgi:SAM-dependent methyltransferase
MVEVSSCVICEAAVRRVKRALVAPFVAERIWNRKPFCVDLVACDHCGFMFYNPRLDGEDLRNLYSGYRSEEYQLMRFATEPWYTKSFNEDLASAKSYEGRRAKIAPILRQHIGQRKVSRVLDHGGDHGDLVLGLIEGAEPFVYDISRVAPTPGVTAIDEPGECKADLIINSNVLEHVGFPRDLVVEILRAAPDGGLVFLEVPCEFATGFSRIIRRIAQIGIIGLRHPFLAKYLFQPAALYMMHEHINYFTENTLKELMLRCGGTVLASGTYFNSGRSGSAEMAWCLASKHS